jgi:hypothetical protein
MEEHSSSTGTGEIEWPIWVPPGEAGWVDWWTGERIQHGARAQLTKHTRAQPTKNAPCGPVFPQVLATSDPPPSDATTAPRRSRCSCEPVR